jgi:hypothetical protein
MIKAIALRAGMLLAVVLTMPVHAAPLVAQVVPLPSVPMSRLGGFASRFVSRGAQRTPLATSRGERGAEGRTSVPVSRGQRGHDMAPESPAPQRIQVLALRHRIKTRYKGHGKGARLAMEIP